MTSRSTAFAATALLSLTTAPAFATSTKTWVSSTGADTGACPLAAPCKTFQYAYSQTTAGGEIDVKDTGSYGSLAITQAISILSGDGALAAVGVPQDGTGITVNAGPNDVVVLKGLYVDGHGVGTNGINFEGGKSLSIKNCRVANVQLNGIVLQPSGGQTFSIVDTEGFGNRVGVFVSSGSSNKINGVIDHAFMHDNNIGMVVQFSDTSVVRSTLTDNNIGMQAYGQGLVLLGGSAISENVQYGIDIESGTVQTYSDNYINANGTDINGGSLAALGRR